MRQNSFLLSVVCAIGLAAQSSSAQEKSTARPRARDLGVPFDGTPGPLNAITDVSGVTVGHTTLISGEGKLIVGRGPVRTGVTAVFPRGKDVRGAGVFGGWWSVNRKGEMTGTTGVGESGLLICSVLDTFGHSIAV